MLAWVLAVVVQPGDTDNDGFRTSVVVCLHVCVCVCMCSCVCQGRRHGGLGIKGFIPPQNSDHVFMYIHVWAKMSCPPMLTEFLCL